MRKWIPSREHACNMEMLPVLHGCWERWKEQVWGAVPGPQQVLSILSIASFLQHAVTSAGLLRSDYNVPSSGGTQTLVDLKVSLEHLKT